MSLEEGCLKKKPEIYLSESGSITRDTLLKLKHRLEKTSGSKTTWIVGDYQRLELEMLARKECGLDKCNKCGSDLRVIIEAHDSYTVEPCVRCKMGDICD